MHGCRQSMTKLHGMGGRTTVEPQLHTSSSKSARRHGGHAPLWSLSSQLWIPQLSLRPHVLSHVCMPSGSVASCSASASWSVTAERFLFLPLLPAVSASWYASGQQVLPHWCLPHALVALHTRAHRYSSVSSTAPVSGSSRVARYGSPHRRDVLLEPQRHTSGTRSLQGGHGPAWQPDVHACPHSSGLAHWAAQSGIGSVHAVRGLFGPRSAERGVCPQGQVETTSGDEGQ